MHDKDVRASNGEARADFSDKDAIIFRIVWIDAFAIDASVDSNTERFTSVSRQRDFLGEQEAFMFRASDMSHTCNPAG